MSGRHVQGISPPIRRIFPCCIVAFVMLTALLPAATVTVTAATATATYTATYTPTPTPTLSTLGGTHVVARGDTLYSIARRYGMTVGEIKRINRLSSDTIYVGQVLSIAVVPTTPAAPTAAPGSTAYAVVRGDTLYSIARRYGTTVNAIVAANHLAGTNIYVGQRLRIPTLTTPTPSSAQGGYTVVQGDTLYAIARRYGTTVDAILAVNHLSSTVIYVGQRLVIPGGRAAATPTPTPISTGTVTPTPTPTLTPMPSGVSIQSIFYNGLVYQFESDEYAVIVNAGTVSQNLNGWRLYADDSGQNFYFPSFNLAPGQTCRVYTNEIHSDYCGFSYGRGAAIWNNEGDCGHLYNAGGAEVSKLCYGDKQ